MHNYLLSLVLLVSVLLIIPTSLALFIIFIYYKQARLFIPAVAIALFISGCAPQAPNQETTEINPNVVEETQENSSSDDAIVEENDTNDSQENDSQTEQEQDTPDKITATVTRVIDGDTIEINMNGTTEIARLLLIDTPETVAPNKPVEPYGPEASQFVKDTLTGQEVEVKVGTEERDHYGRLLTYIFIDDETIQEKLLRKGLARTAYLYNDLTMLDTFHRAQAEAIDQGIGIWSIPGYAHKDHNHGFHYEEDIDTSPEPTPPTTDQNDTNYKNCTAARDAGVTPIHNGDPGYGTHLDRDGDGIACE
ncbi:thermonuclease family protein [Radiobacillus sp. PE A8.2]|uniref:thermonuclease family protein n=1 Tax=Radiobacillus sp. PE A8.2 TaxID=3380349 RepID=UPI00388FBBEF